MTKRKNKQSFWFLNVSWLPIFLAGTILGVFSQCIPEVKNYTDPLVKQIETHVKKYYPFDDVTNEKPTYIVKDQVKPSVYYPVSSFLIERSGYTLAYDASRRNPQWVYEYLTAQNLQGSANRSHADFKEDTSIPSHLRATLADYKGNGLDRGHMSPAADHRSSLTAMADTFYMSNMCPQCPEFNRGYWSKLERHVRDLTKQYDSVHVITGPLYLPYTDTDGKRYVKYQVIGKNDVAVPTHFFKVLMTNERNGQLQTVAYILPNEPIPSSTQLEVFQTTIQKIEKASGVLFSNK